jgi:hypothetical protein
MGNAYSIKGEKYKTADLPELLTCVKGDEVLVFLKDQKVLLPRAIRINALRDSLKETLLAERQKANQMIEADKNNVDINISKRAERLNWFEKFCETQLENELIEQNNDGINKQYFLTLWTNLLKDIKKQGVSKESIEAFIEAHYDTTKELPNVKEFNQTLDHCFFDKEGNLDGLTINQFKETILYSSSVKELDMIAAKYDVKIPKNLKRDQVQEAIILELKKKGSYNEKEHQILDGFTTKQLEEFASANDLIASRYISKPQAIDYLLRNAHTTKDVFEAELSAPIEEKPQEVIEEKVEEKVEVTPEVVSVTTEDEALVTEPKWTTKTKQGSKALQALLFKVKKIRKPKKALVVDETTKPNEDAVPMDKLDLILRQLERTNDNLEALLRHHVPVRIKKVIFGLFVLSVGFAGFVVFTYFYRDVFLLRSIVNLLNRIPFLLNRGIMDFFYRLFEVLILRR